MKDFWGIKKKNKSAEVIWRGFDAICVCPLIDHGQQPMKMPTEVTLLYIYIYLFVCSFHAVLSSVITVHTHGKMLYIR